MIRHLLKMVWNRRRSSMLIAIEILLSFIVLTVVMTMVVFYIDNSRKPVGFDIENVWVIQMAIPETEFSSALLAEPQPGDQAANMQSGESRARKTQERVLQLMQVLGDMPEVEAVAAAQVTPYGPNTSSSDITIKGRRHAFGSNVATDGFARAMGLSITRGRWFGPEDDGSGWEPVVINERLAREMFPAGDPVGQSYSDDRPGNTPPTKYRVVGVIREFRKDGEYAVPENFLFNRSRLDGTSRNEMMPRDLVVRVRPGTTAAFEEAAVTLLRRAAPDWTFQSEALVSSRATALRYWMAPLLIAGIVSVFLLLMVGLGLTGVLWLQITQRIRELGLRRATGATARNIRRQVVGEVVVLTTVAAAIGVALVIQFPVLDLLPAVEQYVYVTGLAISAVCLYLLTITCAWAPSRLASSIEPAEALRWE